VAGVAVLVSGILQYLTLRRAKESAVETLGATERTARMAALSSATTVWEQGLREDLAKFPTLSYEVETAYKWAMDRKLPWPGDEAENVAAVETAFNRILLRLDRDVPSESALIGAVEAMRHDEKQLWVERRKHLVDAALAAFRARWSDNLSI
ncbi:MAG TPA: hypothetical protein VGB06_08825, partial [Solirubrobacterales bacterium]